MSTDPVSFGLRLEVATVIHNLKCPCVDSATTWGAEYLPQADQVLRVFAKWLRGLDISEADTVRELLLGEGAITS